MKVPVPILTCDACERRLVLCAAAFTALRGHGHGHFCQTCRERLPEEPPEG